MSLFCDERIIYHKIEVECAAVENVNAFVYKTFLLFLANRMPFKIFNSLCIVALLCVFYGCMYV